jgi:cytochrome c oxidase subunit 1
VPHPSLDSVAARASHVGSATHVAVPGTVVLATLLLVSFVLYYFVNWKYLSEVWALG